MNAQPQIYAPAEMMTAAMVWDGLVLEHAVGQSAEHVAACLRDFAKDYPESSFASIRYSIPNGIIVFGGLAPEGVTYAVVKDGWMMEHRPGQTLEDAIHDHDGDEALQIVRYDLRAGTIADVTAEAVSEIIETLDRAGTLDNAPGWLRVWPEFEEALEASESGAGDWWPGGGGYLPHFIRP